MSRKQAKDWNPYVAGTLLGIVLFFAFFLTSNGLGGSGGYLRFTAFLEDVFLFGHVDHNQYLVKFVGGDKGGVLNSYLVYNAIGLILGGGISGFISGRTKLEWLKGPRASVALRIGLAFTGGMIVGWSARLARGCTSGQAMSGSTGLSLGSWLFMFAVFAGAYGAAWFLRREWR